MRFRSLMKIINIILISLLIFCFISTVYAANGLDVTVFENPDAPGTERVTNLVNSTTGTAISVIRVAAVSIAVIMLLVIAMRYMLSSAGDRADIKKHAVAYVVGAFILFGVTGILSALVSLSEQFNSTTGS